MNNFLSRGKLLDLDNTTKVPLTKVGLMAGEIYDGLEFPQQFGFKSYPPKTCEVITAHFGGNRNHGTVLNAFDRNLMPTDLEEGESCLYNAGLGRVLVDKDSNIIITNEAVTVTLNNSGAITIETTGALTIESPSVSFTGAVNVVGDLTVTTINGEPYPPEP